VAINKRWWLEPGPVRPSCPQVVRAAGGCRCLRAAVAPCFPWRVARDKLLARSAAGPAPWVSSSPCGGARLARDWGYTPEHSRYGVALVSLFRVRGIPSLRAGSAHAVSGALLPALRQALEVAALAADHPVYMPNSATSFSATQRRESLGGRPLKWRWAGPGRSSRAGCSTASGVGAV